MKRNIEQIRQFVDGVVCALDHRIEISEDKNLEWSTNEYKGKARVDFTWTTGFEIESQGAFIDGETLFLDGTEQDYKIVRDIEDILERVDDVEIEWISRRDKMDEWRAEFAD